MMKTLKTIAIAGGLGIGLASCGNSGGTVLTPQPPPGKVSYFQIERLSRPAVKEVFETFNNHKFSNSTEPTDTTNDPLFASIKATEDALRPPVTVNGKLVDYGAALQGVFYPDKYAVDLDQAAGTYLGVEINSLGFGPPSFGGRNITDDVVGLSLSAAFGSALVPIVGEDNQENHCLSKQNLTSAAGPQPTGGFPYLAQAH